MGNKAKTQKIREHILEKVDHYPDRISKIIQDEFALTKQGAFYHLNALVKEGILMTEGLRKSKVYREKPQAHWRHCFELEGLDEHRVWDEIKTKGILPELDKDKTGFTLMYGFTEMLNNAIDHSEGTQACVEIQVFQTKIKATISDDGIGIFKKVMREENLSDERHAILLLSKGKYTSMPEAHTGQGIFFTSKAFDFFDIISGDICFIHEKEGCNDWLLDTHQYSTGTSVVMEIGINSSLNMQDLFGKFTSDGEDLPFDTTIVPVKRLGSSGEALVSRSQAKRLMVGLHKFEQVRLDFRGVDRIGQAFADEIFRVWRNRNLEINLTASGYNSSVKKMIRRVTESKN